METIDSSVESAQASRGNDISG